MKRMIDIVHELESAGHRVQYRVRSDGGIIVKSLDGQVFHDLTSGNKVARSMVVGGELPMAQLQQRQFNVKKYIKLRENEKKVTGSIDSELLKKLRRVQRIRREYGRLNEGKVSKKKLRYYVDTEGRERAWEYLDNRERYYKGYAYKENVDFLVATIRLLKGETNNRKLWVEIDRVADIIASKWEDFKEDWIYPCHEALYGNKKKAQEKLDDLKKVLPSSWF